MRFVFTVLLAAVPALACSCMGSHPPCEAAWQSAAVFTGTVADIEPLSPQSLELRARLRLREAFLGVEGEPAEIEVITHSQSSACGYRFERGQSYLIYAYRRPDGALGTVVCQRTRPLSDAAEDLGYLRGLPAAPPEGRIFGELLIAGTRAGVKVTVEGAGIRREAVSGPGGDFSFPGLPAGEYRVGLERQGLMPVARERLQLHSKGCIAIRQVLGPDWRVRGRVLDAEGRPAAGVQVQALRLGPEARSAVSGTSDAKGFYQIGLLEPGDYLVGFNLDRPPTRESPYVSFYYPGTTDRALAAPIHVDERPQVHEADLQAPAPLREITISGMVSWPDGRPAAGAVVEAEDPRFPAWRGQYRVQADAQGHFTLTVYGGTRYILRATQCGPEAMRSNANRRACATAPPREIAPGADSVRLILNPR